jgi:hypothetical protein
VIYALLAAIIVARANLVSSGISEGGLGPATWIVVAYFFLGIGLNLASGASLSGP